MSSKKAAEERSHQSAPTEHARICEQKRQEAEKAAQAVFEGRFASVNAALRSGEFETSAKITRQVLSCLQKRDRELLPSECDSVDTLNEDGGTTFISSTEIEFDEEKSGVYSDNRGINQDATRVQFVFNLTMSDGHVEPFVVGWNGATWDRQHDLWAGEEECFIHYHDPRNKEKALVSAQKKWDQLEKVAKSLAAREIARGHKRMWSEKQRMLRSKAEQITQLNSIRKATRKATNRDVAKALCNVALAVANVAVGPGIDFNGQGGTEISGPWAMDFPRHRSTAAVSYNHHCDGDHPESDNRRNRKGRVNDLAASAPVQIDCKMLELVKSDSINRVNHTRARNVLKSIAKKAGGAAIAEMMYPATTASTHKLTTRRESFLPIFDLTQLINVYQVICEGIELFGKTDSCYNQEKKDWPIPLNWKKTGGQKRKRG
eukprot:scaffold44209_cov62-Phaeocystis_antarctica.AAC.1